MTSKPGGVIVPGKAWRISTYWPGGVRCKGDASLIQAFVRNLRTWLAMEREKVQAQQREAESTDATARGGLPRSSGEAGNSRGAKGAGHSRQDGVNGQPDELLVLAEAGRLPRGGTSRMNREVHVRNL